ncbi:MAG: HlyD family efflux transporter periplasmic adaptor subunit [Fuerstiella sp.]|nr:HlyD family efflux transporter periplasmic adaptor subunit [Fuerstiella sp.]MCP4857319.1 HlyD family efflux transporter periplasmic adaptor subunit [Fuerstiella sp.]
MSNEVDLRELAIDRGSTGQPGIRTRRNVFTRYVLPLVLFLGFLSLVAWASRDLMFPPTAVTVVPVFSTIAEVQQEGMPLFKAAGWIEPRPTPVRVAALAPGVVEKLLVVEDQPVKAGDPIAELVREDAKLTHERALADLELRQAEVDEANAAFAAADKRFRQPVHLQAPLNEAEASLARIDTLLKNLPFEVRRAEADYKALRRDYEGKVSAKGVIAGTEIDIAESKADAAKAMVEELGDRASSLSKERAALAGRSNAMKTQLKLLADETNARDSARAQIKATTARVGQARVVVAEAELQLARMTIVAPVDGRVFRLIAHPGARIGSGMTQMSGHDGSTVITMYRPDMLQVRVDTRFEDIPKVSLGQSVEIDNPALSSPLTGKVLFVSSEADIQKNTLQVKVEIPDPPQVFKPEMLVDVTFLSQRASAESEEPEARVIRVFVPQNLIQHDGTDVYVWLADQSAKLATRQAVQTGGVDNQGLIEVTSGLDVSSRLIVTGTDSLTHGCRIRITGEEPNTGIAPAPLTPGS